jgi:hypothetical protein
MARNRLSPSRGREDIRAWWAEHLAAQRKSGQTQAAYCRAQGLDPKYFTLWKGKLRDAEMAGLPRMVPVVVDPTVEPPASAMPKMASASVVVPLRLLLGSGISLSRICSEVLLRKR